MKKILLVFMTAILILLLTGCVNLNVTCGVTTENTAFLRYDILFDLADYPQQQKLLKNMIRDFTIKYRSKGFTVEENIDQSTDIVEVKLEYTLTGQTRQQAFDNLKQILTDKEITPFTKVDMDSEKTKLEQAFSMEIEADFSEIIAEKNMEEFIPSMRDKFASSLDAATGQLTLELPGDKIESASSPVEQVEDICRLTANIDKDAPSVIYLRTHLKINDDKQVNTLQKSMLQSEDALKEYAQKLDILYITMAVLAVSAILLILWMILARKKRKRLLVGAVTQEK